jgi:toxin ParE1/3/4
VRPFRFHPDALTELTAALDWYALRYAPAADALAQAIDEGFATIRRLPFVAPPVAGDTVRALNLRMHGYSIIYTVGDEIVILAVAHQRRHPRYWLRRARGT